MTKQIEPTETKQIEENPRKLIDAPNQEKKERGDKHAEKQQAKKEREEKRAVRRIFPIWLRLIVIALLCLLAVIIGLVVGYSILGDGEPLDVLRFDFWQRIIDIINGVE